MPQRGLLGCWVASESDDSDYEPAVHEDDLPLSERLKLLQGQKKGSTKKRQAPTPSPKSRKAPRASSSAAASTKNVKTASDQQAAALIASGGAGGESLNPDLLRIVFTLATSSSALPVAAAVPCVCRLWRDVAADMPEMWGTLDLSLPQLKLSNELVLRLVQSGRWREVHHLKLAPRAPVMKGKREVMGGLSETALLGFAQHCGNSITTLDLSGQTAEGVPEFRMEALEQAITDLPSLTHLNISDRVIIPRSSGVDRVVRAALTPRTGQLACPLVKLTAANCPTLSRATVGVLFMPNGVQRHGQQQQQPSQSSQQQQQQGEQQQQQQQPSSQPSQQQAAAPDRALVPALLHLKEVDLNFSGTLDSGMAMSPEAFQMTAPHLEVLKIIGLGGVFGWEVNQTQNNWKEAPGWASLQILELGAGEHQGRPGISSLTSNVLLRFAGKSSKLRHLEISGHALPALKPDVFQHLSGAVCLESLSLRRCTLASDAGLQAVADHCPSLEELDLGSNRGAVGDAGVEALSRACLKLCAIDLSGSSVTDQGLRALLACPDLHQVDISACRGLSRSLRSAGYDLSAATLRDVIERTNLLN